MSSTRDIKYTKVTCLTNNKNKSTIVRAFNPMETKDDRDKAALDRFNALQVKYGLRFMIYTH